MIVGIDFSLYSSPTDALGNVTGDMNVPDSVHVGDIVRVLSPKADDWFSGELTIVSIARQQDPSNKPLIGLEDVVAHSLDEANSLAARLEAESGLFFDRYE